ncbi:SPOR domain-containing protein [Psychromonas sp. Urea-02u-13]|uniref:SPOR domain-containing protein n=1 Tax=Psychromonas sp. Urea-02u-13 TaxID=2058326 RepID=UPI000C347467|nr:SPOR domain-containing protein [Psychromonas sp. Urea-02u-13]PKG37800.1 hypothetical protein CXF74_16980 [Psychromonas sp. Urea-02u-13]
MHNLLRNTLIFILLIAGLSACSSNDAQISAQEKIAQENEKKQQQLAEKVAQLEGHVENWKVAEPSVERLITIEKDLRLLISQLNALVIEAENEKTLVAQQEKMAEQRQAAPAENTAMAKKTSAKNKKLEAYYTVQLVSISNVKMVEKSWSDIYKKNANVLTDHQPLIEQVQVKNKTYYRIKTGKFSSKNEAVQVCNQLKKQSVSCMASVYSGQPLDQFLLSMN